jgi:hypothetical protein
MTKGAARELFEKGFINESQFQRIDAITSGKVVSVFYELRTLLYLGVLLFTTGTGILIYLNIGEFGHLLSIVALSLLTGLCFWYALMRAVDYSPEKVNPPTPYYDYVVLLGSLLFISVQGYLQFRYGFLTDNLGYSTLLTAAFFFFIAYRLDHVGILSLAITAFASFWSISVSPQKWYSGDFFSGSHLYNTAIIFSSALAAMAVLIHRRGIKTHFTFTYLNFCSLIFFVGAISGLFAGRWWGIYLLAIYGGCIFAYYMARWKKSFLFLLYAFVSAYIGTTYFLARTIFAEAIEIWFFYSIASCGGFIYFVIKFKNYFKQDE